MGDKGHRAGPVERDRWQVSILVWGAIKYKQTSMLEMVNGTLTSKKFHDFLKSRLMKNLPNLRQSSPLDIESNTLIF